MSHGRYVYVHTFGCQMNVYDTERMLEAMGSIDYTPTDSPERADLILLNTCSVREKAEDKAFSMLGRYALLRENNPDLILGLGGCMATRMKEKLFKRGLPLDIVFGPDNITELPTLVQDVSNRREARAHSVRFLPRSQYEFPTAAAPTDNRVASMVTVMKGCNKFCSFCIVPTTRGREVSKPPQQVVEETRTLVKAGVREVMLLGQNVNSYGHDLKRTGTDVSFADLLAMVNDVDGLYRIRFTTSHPWDATEALARAFRDLPKVCPYLHLPLQSGSDPVLENMKRGYTLETYLELVARLRSYRPDIALSTDIIVGFPGETEADFQKTLDAIETIRFDSLFIFKYSVRPGTPAAELEDDVPPEIKQERLERVLEMQNEITRDSLANYVGKTVEILVEGFADRPAPGGTSLQLKGRTDSNVIVNVDVGVQIKNPWELVGTLLPVEITKARKHSLAGQPVNPHRSHATQTCASY
ncbi:MAG: tRNA (N6-isopentenyl adenosine(37)-C2)-methylthiotransferase MiaB [Myxococcales bacterium]|nr:tRNA (N6-isopentenyl adenosine(37)-C2)-methylthiotransferase MiaB [Myxococcales bacterium]